MARPVLLGGADVEEGHVALPHPVQELAAADGLQRFRDLEVVPHDLLDVGQTALGQRSESEPEAADGLVGKAIENVKALLACLDETGLPEHLEVLGAVGQAEGSLSGQALYRSLPLGQQIKQLQTLGARELLPYAGKLLVELVFKHAALVRHT